MVAEFCNYLISVPTKPLQVFYRKFTGMQHRTAILLFARTPEEEALHKPLPHGMQVHHALVEHALGLCSGLEATLIHWDQRRQVGSTFGEKITHALEQVWLGGFSSVLLLGGDTPGLSGTMLRTALSELKLGNQVLGPSVDGGCYLIGLQRRHFDAQQFEALPWNSCKLLADIKEFLGSSILLPLLHDIDSKKGLYQFVNRRDTSGIQEILRKILNPAGSAIFFEKDLGTPWDEKRNLSIRGSPAALAS